MLDRRALIKLGLYGGTGGLLHLAHLKSGVWGWALDETKKGAPPPRSSPPKGGGGMPSPPGGTYPSTITLPIPPGAQPVNVASLPGAPLIPGATYYEVSMALGQVQYFPSTMGPGTPTMFLGYAPPPPGIVAPAIRGHLGPTFVAKIGEPVVVRMHNNLPGSTTTAIVHHHGGHTPSVSDGSALYSQQIPNGSFRDYVYPNDDDISATHWYHDHDIDVTGHNVFLGLQGLFPLWDDVERALNLPGNPITDPASHGAPFDLPLVFQDRLFDTNNQIAFDPFNSDGMLGNIFMINGAIQPSLTVFNRRYRLRLMNGCNARFFQLSLSDPRATLYIIGSDGGLFKSPLGPVTSVRLGPAERVEVIVDFKNVTPGPNVQVFLRNSLSQTGGREPNQDCLTTGTCPNLNAVPGMDGLGALLRFDVSLAWPGSDNSFNPAVQTTLRTDLPSFGDPNAPGVVHRTWVFERGNGAWVVNGQLFDPGPPGVGPPRIDAHVAHGAAEIWTLQNNSGGWYHPVHIHRNQFYILDRNGSATNVLPQETGLKDVFVLGGNETVRVFTRYDGIVNDTSGIYVMHCHNLAHEDMRMMVAWQVCNPTCG